MKPNSDELAIERTELNSSRRDFFRAATRGVSQTFESPEVPAINVGRPKTAPIRDGGHNSATTVMIACSVTVMSAKTIAL